jgi:hypothetical protein
MGEKPFFLQILGFSFNIYIYIEMRHDFYVFAD